MNKPRLLKPEEIQCRIQSIKKSRTNKVGAIILLYKDARVDMDILDELYGKLNWKRNHFSIDGRLYCTISVYDPEKDQWVDKSDVGTESNTEKEKGQASDSFKRAGTNWGIGRELYSAPFIYIVLGKEEYSHDDKKDRYRCWTDFHVSEIDYNDNKVSRLVILDSKGNQRFSFGSVPAKPKQTKTEKGYTKKKDAEDEKIIDNGTFNTIKTLGLSKGFSLDDINAVCQKSYKKDLKQLNNLQAGQIKIRLEAAKK